MAQLDGIVHVYLVIEVDLKPLVDQEMEGRD